MKWYWVMYVGFIAVIAALDVSGFVHFTNASHAVGWIVVLLVLISGGWMGFDGGRALIVGDYVTPKSGKQAGQLGTWSKFVCVVGIDPRSTLMKSIFLVYGLLFVGVMTAYALGAYSARWPLAITAALGLWYWSFGTVINVVIVTLVLL